MALILIRLLRIALFWGGGGGGGGGKQDRDGEVCPYERGNIFMRQVILHTRRKWFQTIF